MTVKRVAVPSPATLARLKEILAREDGARVNRGMSGAIRQVCFVDVTHEEQPDGWYRGTPELYLTRSDSWEAFVTSKVREANDNPLEVGRRYLGIRVGDDDGKTPCYRVWNADGAAYQTDVGDGSTNPITVTHDLGTRDLIVSVRENASPYEFVFPTIGATTLDTVTLTFTSTPTTDQFRVIVLPRGGGAPGVDGPGSSTNNALVRWSGTSGRTLADSAVTLSAAGAMAGALSLTGGASGLTVTGSTASGGSLVQSGTSHATAGPVDTLGDTGTADSTTTFSVARIRRVATGGTPGVGFGITEEFRMPNQAGTEMIAAALDLIWTAVGAGAEAARIALRARVAGALVDVLSVLAGALTLRETTTPATPAAGYGALWFDGSGDLNTIDDAGNVTTLGSVGDEFPRWTKVTKTYTDFSTGATTNTVTLYTLPAGWVVHGVKLKHSTSFTGGAIAAYQVTGVGVSGGATTKFYSTAHSIFQATGATVGKVAGSLPPVTAAQDIESQDATSTITITVTSSGANLDAATQGSLDVWLLLGEAV